MPTKIQKLTTISTLATIALTAALISPPKASAEQWRNNASYIGGGIAAGATNDRNVEDLSVLGGSIQGRLALKNTAISLRGAMLFGEDSNTIIPTISYDLPISRNANAYLGIGYSFVEEGKVSPLGDRLSRHFAHRGADRYASRLRLPLRDRDAAVVTIGGEMQVGNHLMVYGDTKLGLDAYENSSDTAVSFQTGLGYKF